MLTTTSHQCTGMIKAVVGKRSTFCYESRTSLFLTFIDILQSNKKSPFFSGNPINKSAGKYVSFLVYNISGLYKVCL